MSDKEKIACNWDYFDKNPIMYPGSFVQTQSCSPDGKFIAVVLGDCIYIIDAKSGIKSPLKGHTFIITSLNYSPDSNFLISASWDRTIRVWNVNTKQQIGNPYQTHTQRITRVLFIKDGFASCSLDNTIQIWNIENRTYKEFRNNSPFLAMEHFRRYLFAVTENQQMIMYNISSGKTLRQRIRGVANARTYMRISSKYTIATANADNVIRIWNTSTRKLVNRFSDHTLNIMTLGFSPDGHYLVSGSWNRSIILRNISNRTKRTLKGQKDRVNCMEFSCDGKYIVSSYFDESIQVQKFTEEI